jgi:hypothetical protein
MILTETFQSFEAKYRGDSKAAEGYLAYGDSPRNPALDVSELAAYTTVANLMMNLDAVLNKE